METEKTLKFPVSMYFQPKQVKIGQAPKCRVISTGALGNHPERWAITRSVGQSPGVSGNHPECWVITRSVGQLLGISGNHPQNDQHHYQVAQGFANKHGYRDYQGIGP
jgi:hypothetical protein